MAGQQKSTLDIVPISGKKLRFNAQAQFDCSSNTFIVDNVGLLNLRSTSGTILKETGGTTQIDVDNGQLILKSSQNANASNSILVDAAGATGGITLNSGTGGITESSTGKILIQSSNSNGKYASIELSASSDSNNNLKSDNQFLDDDMEGDILIKSSNDILADCNDFTLVASDAIKFISTTGDIGFGSTAAASILKFESKTSGSITNTNLIVNQATSSNDRVLDVLVSNESTLEPGYNGILINTDNPNVAADLAFKSSDGLNHFSLGVFPEAFNFSYHQEYIIKTVGNSKIIYPINDLDFVESDIGRRVYFTQQNTQQNSNQTDTIASLGTTILAVDSTNARSDITTSGTYTGATSAIYRIEIDYQNAAGSIFTFKWSNDAGKTYQGTHKKVEASPLPPASSAPIEILLEKGISIIFTSSTGHQVGDYWTFHAKRTAILTTTDRNITTSEIMYTLLDNVGYIRSPLINDFNFSTSGHKRLEITAEGVVGINSEKPTSTLEITNNHNKTLQVNEEESNYQLFPSVASLKSGGYIVVWASASNININNYNIYYQKYSSDGQKIGTSQTSTVNKAQVSHQTWPHVAGQNTANSNKFAVVWMSKVTDDVSIYLQIYNNTTKVSSENDILVNINNNIQTNTDLPSDLRYQNQLYPKVVGLSNGKFLITYPEYDNGINKLKISGKIFSDTGSLVTSFQVNNSYGFDSLIYPYPFALSANDLNYPGGFGVVFMKEYKTSNGSEVSNNERFKIQFTVFSLNGDTQIAETSNDTNIVDSNGNIITIDLESHSSSQLTISEGLVSAQGCIDGGFIISFYRSHEGTINSSVNSAAYTSQTITGNTSTATATISSVSNNILNLTNINGRFLIDELITIGGNYTEKIKSVDYTSETTAILTLSDNYESIQMYKYNTAGIGTHNFNSITNATPRAAFQQTAVHTSNLVADSELLNYHTREIENQGQDTTTFKRPLVSIAEMANKDLVVVWCNGDISSIYYQILSGIDGSKIGTEKQISKKYSSLKQRGVMVAATTSAQNLDSGFVVVWQNEVLDTSSNSTSNLPSNGDLELETDKHNTGIYQSIIQPNNNLIEIFNEDSNFSISQEGKLGIGTNSPTELLHLKNSDTIDTSNLLFQHNHSNIKTNNLIGNIKYQNNDGIELSILKGGYSNNYQSLNPDSDNLIAYFKLDDTARSQTAKDSTITGVIAKLENFDINTCWVDGIINGGLRFDGMNTYVEINDSNLNNLSLSSFNNNGFSISCWVKIDTNILTGATYNILGNLSESLTVTATENKASANGVTLSINPLSGPLYAGDDIIFSNNPEIIFKLTVNARFGDTSITGNLTGNKSNEDDEVLANDTGTVSAKIGSYSISLIDTGSSTMKANFKLISGDKNTYTATGTTKINDDNWHHLIAVYNNIDIINKIYIYVDGTLEATTSVTESINTISEIKTYLGCIHGETSDDTMFKGDLSEIRFYKSSLTNNQITLLNNRGSKNLGKLTFTAQSGLNNTETSHMANGFTVDETGALQGASLKNHGIYKLDGTVSLTANTNVMTGTETLLNSNLSTGDTIVVDGNDYIVDQVSSETSMTITTTPTSDIISKKVIRKAAITSFLDQDNNIKGVMNNNGALSLGGFNPTSKLELRSTSTSGDYPYIHLCNNSETYIDNAGETRVVFQGIKRFSDVTQTLAGTFFELSGTRIANSLNYNVFSNNVFEKNYKIRVSLNGNPDQIQVSTDNGATYGNPINIVSPQNKTITISSYDSSTGVITKSQGNADGKPDFKTNDVGKYLILPDGTTTIITARASANQITIALIAPTTNLPSLSLSTGNIIRIKVNSLKINGYTDGTGNINKLLTTKPDFTSSDVGKNVILPNGTSKQILTFVDSNNITIESGLGLANDITILIEEQQDIGDNLNFQLDHNTGFSVNDNWTFSLPTSISSVSKTIANPSHSITPSGTNTQQVTYKLRIDATGTPDTFEWNNDGSNSFPNTGIAITGSSQVIENSVSVTFSSTTGHSIGDIFEFTVENDVFSNITTTITNPNHNITVMGSNNNTDTKTYTIEIFEISNPNKFKWKENITNTYSSLFDITGFNQSLENGLEIKFDATTGHTIGDTWTFVSTLTNATISNVSPINETVSNMLSLTGTYNENSNKRYQVKIDSIGTNFGDTCTFKWSNDAGISYDASQLEITGGEQILENDVKIQFPTTNGFTLNDTWDFTGLSISNSTTQDFSYIEGAHQDTSMDSKGKMRFYVNNGTTPTETLSIHNNGRIGIGSSVSPLGNLQVNGDTNTNSNLVLFSKSSSTKVFGEDSNIYFTGTDGLSDGSNVLETGSYSKISGSSNDVDANISGRLDFFTNNNDNSNGLTSRMSILHNGNIGIDLPMAQNLFSVSPKTNYSGTSTKVSGNILLETPFNNAGIFEGFVVFDNNAKTTSIINEITDTTHLKVDNSNINISSTNMDIYLPGLNVDSNGYVGIGSSKMNSKLQVNGAIATSIKSINTNESPYSITIEDSTILLNSSNGPIIITLPNLTNSVTGRNIKGRIYVIKKISNDTNIITVNTTGSETIDGLSSFTGQLLYNDSITIQTDGSNWYIISKYNA
tara:strand:- start:2057 stop:9787 length:7731 start_codon:yes stop_codon:yes gene_type:complete